MSDTTEVKPVDLEAGRELCGNATPGPWRWVDTEFMAQCDTDFCIAARTLLPAALDEIEMLREKVEHLTKAFRLNAGYKVK